MLPQDTEASLRAQLAAQVANAQSDIESHLAALRDAVARGGNGAVLSQATDQLTSLSRLQKRIGGGDIASLAAIRGEVAMSVAATQALVQTAAAQGTAPQSAQAELYAASANADRATRDFEKDFYERRIFDPYLRFASKDDEEAYRHREAERQLAIEKARAEHTPEGNLRANELSIDQLHDAGRHGADRSPEYKAWDAKLAEAHDNLAGAIDKSHHPSVVAARTEQRDSVKPGAKVSPDVLAALRDAGVTVPDQSGSGHGVTVQGTGRTIQLG